jgi:methyl-accepting chemotaxis protein
MNCTSKWCGWLQAISQFLIAMVIVYAGFIVNSYMESWTLSFQRGSDDLHSIRNNMNNIAYSMESINNDMDNIKTEMQKMSTIGNSIDGHMSSLNTQLNTVTQQMNTMNYSVGRMNNKFSPQGMFGSLSPF